MTRTRIAAVSYLNTIPFIHGIRHAGNDLRAELLLSPPAGCAEALETGKADIALIPVAGIPGIQNIEIIGNHCIGAHESVRTVVLMSVSPLEEIHTVYLDPHSRTSVALVRVLADNYWNIAPRWLPLTDFDDVKPTQGVGYTLIGDKVFGYEPLFPYNYDLAGAWHAWTGLPFVFAAWVARRGVDPHAVQALEKALDYGVDHIEEAVTADLVERQRGIDHTAAVRYLTENIDFRLDGPKRQSMQLFFEKMPTP